MEHIRTTNAMEDRVTVTVKKADLTQLAELRNNSRFAGYFAVSAIQRALGFGYNRARRVIEQGVECGILETRDQEFGLVVMFASPMSEKCYSVNEEEYSHDIQDVFDHFEENYEVGDAVEYWEADSISHTHDSISNHRWLADTVIEHLQEQASEIGGEYASDYLDDIGTSDDKRTSLRSHIVNWLNENAKQPTFFTAENSVQIKGWWNGEEVQQTPMMSATELQNVTE